MLCKQSTTQGICGRRVTVPQSTAQHIDASAQAPRAIEQEQEALLKAKYGALQPKKKLLPKARAWACSLCVLLCKCILNSHGLTSVDETHLAGRTDQAQTRALSQACLLHTQLAAAALADSLGVLERRTTSTLTAPTTSWPSRACRAQRRLACRGASWRPSSPRALRRRAAPRTWERRRHEAAGAARRLSADAAMAGWAQRCA